MTHISRLPEGIFCELVEEYRKFNEQCAQRLIYRVGTGAGFYSELGSMLACMLYCCEQKIAFELYADDATFANSEGWEEFFVPFCSLNHDPLNKIANYRFKWHYRDNSGRLRPNIFLKRFFWPSILKRRTKADYLTQDVFAKFRTPEFGASPIKLPLFNLEGLPRDIYGQLSGFAMRHNTTTLAEIEALKCSVRLPEHYISIQIRGGDKAEEFDKLIDVKSCLDSIDSLSTDVNNIFVFTDDYRNVTEIRRARPEWNVYTLTNPAERGYYNADFNRLPWRYRRDNLIKLFAIVDICINSNLHIGCEGACVSAFIRSARNSVGYVGLKQGKFKKKNLTSKLKNILLTQ